MDDNKKWSDLFAGLMSYYFINGCDDCPCLGLEEEEEVYLEPACDAVPINCKWWHLKTLFEALERKYDKEGEEHDVTT